MKKAIVVGMLLAVATLLAWLLVIPSDDDVQTLCEGVGSKWNPEKQTCVAGP